LSIESQIGQLRERLRKRTGCRDDEIRVVRSPLRVSPLGAHVDHQDGLVTGMALDRAIYLAFVPREDGIMCVESLNFPGCSEFNLESVPPKIQGEWANYARGAVLALKQSYDLRTGIDAVVMGMMPIGGLSSSAAVGVAYLLAIEAVNDLELPAEENIQLDRYIENVYLGLKNGVMDQSVILLSDRDCLTYLDCQTMDVQRVPTSASPMISRSSSLIRGSRRPWSAQSTITGLMSVTKLPGSCLSGPACRIPTGTPGCGWSHRKFMRRTVSGFRLHLTGVRVTSSRNCIACRRVWKRGGPVASRRWAN